MKNLMNISDIFSELSQGIVIIIMVDFYTAFSHVQYILKALHTILPQQACDILHIYSWTIQAHLIPGLPYILFYRPGEVNESLGQL